MSAHLKSIFLSVGIVFLIALVLIGGTFRIAQGKEYKLDFPEEIMAQLNQLWIETPQDTEFFVILEEENQSVQKATLVGYKYIKTNKNWLVKNDATLEGNILLHSHPYSNLCYLSPMDLLNRNEIDCIMCKENKVRCWGK